MAKFVSSYQLLGFSDLFPDEKPKSKIEYGKLTGSNLLLTFACCFLGHNRFPKITDHQLLKNWFSKNNPDYDLIISNYNKIENPFNSVFEILSVESLLKLFCWAFNNNDIPKEKSGYTFYSEADALRLYMLFNDDILNMYEIAQESIEGFNDEKQIQRIILSNSFSQNDLINIDYALLLQSQIYKSASLMTFLENNDKTKRLHNALLSSLSCDNSNEAIGYVGSTVLSVLKGEKPGWRTLRLERNEIYQKNISFLNSITLEEDILEEGNDYLQLRNKPFQKINDDEYRVVFDLFLIKKIFNGMYFKMLELTKSNPGLIDEDFSGFFKTNFSEAYLAYEILNYSFPNNDVIKITGNEFKKAGVTVEPDYYLRDNSDIFLFESKDVFIRADIKASYNFLKIEKEIKKRFYKDENNGKTKNGAVLQLVNNIGKVFNKQLRLDENYVVPDFTIYPILLVHDSIFSTPGLNYWVNYWFFEELEKESKNLNIDISKVRPITIVEIDTLIFYIDNLMNKSISFKNVISSYINHTKFGIKQSFISKENVEKSAFSSAIPFSEYFRDYCYDLDIPITHNFLSTLLKKFGIK